MSATSTTVGETLKLTPSESLTIVSSTPRALEVEATYGPGGRAPPKHLHPSQDESFRLLEGAIRVSVGGERRDLATGDELEIPRGTPHQMWNPFAEPARVGWTTAPAGRTEQWFRAVDALHRSGRVGEDGVPSPLAFAVLLAEYGDCFRLAAAPNLVLRPALAALAAVGRLRGYRAQPDGRSPTQ